MTSAVDLLYGSYFISSPSLCCSDLCRSFACFQRGREGRQLSFLEVSSFKPSLHFTAYMNSAGCVLADLQSSKQLIQDMCRLPIRAKLFQIAQPSESVDFVRYLAGSKAHGYGLREGCSHTSFAGCSRWWERGFGIDTVQILTPSVVCHDRSQVEFFQHRIILVQIIACTDYVVSRR